MKTKLWLLASALVLASPPAGARASDFAALTSRVAPSLYADSARMSADYCSSGRGGWAIKSGLNQNLVTGGERMYNGWLGLEKQLDDVVLFGSLSTPATDAVVSEQGLRADLGRVQLGFWSYREVHGQETVAETMNAQATAELVNQPNMYLSVSGTKRLDPESEGRLDLYHSLSLSTGPLTWSHTTQVELATRHWDGGWLSSTFSSHGRQLVARTGYDRARKIRGYGGDFHQAIGETGALNLSVWRDLEADAVTRSAGVQWALGEATFMANLWTDGLSNRGAGIFFSSTIGRPKREFRQTSLARVIVARVFHDENGNGLWDPSERPLSGAEIVVNGERAGSLSDDYGRVIVGSRIAGRQLDVSARSGSALLSGMASVTVSSSDRSAVHVEIPASTPDLASEETPEDDELVEEVEQSS